MQRKQSCHRDICECLLQRGEERISKCFTVHSQHDNKAEHASPPASTSLLTVQWAPANVSYGLLLIRIQESPARVNTNIQKTKNKQTKKQLVRNLKKNRLVKMKSSHCPSYLINISRTIWIIHRLILHSEAVQKPFKLVSNGTSNSPNLVTDLSPPHSQIPY